MLYLDSSALVKRYVREPGRNSLVQRLKTGGHLYSSAISYAEIHAALARKHREGELSRVEFLRARNDFEVDWLEMQEVSVNHETLGPIVQLVEHVPLRGMDAIHLAAAIWLQRKFKEAPQIVSSDPRLLKAARRFRFDVYDPVGAEQP